MKYLVAFLITIIIGLTAFISYNYGFYQNEIVVEKKLKEILKEDRDIKEKNSILYYFKTTESNTTEENNNTTTTSIIHKYYDATKNKIINYYKKLTK